MKMKIVLLCLAVFLIVFPSSVYSHPHVWTDYVVHPIFNNQGLQGFRFEWTFDEMFSAQIMEMVGLRKGNPSAAQVRKIREEAFDNLAQYNYFVHIWVDGERFQIRGVRDFTARVQDNRMVYDFFVPCEVDARTGARSVRLQVRDPEIFVDFSMSAQAPVRLVSSPDITVEYSIDQEGSGALGGFFAPKSLNLRFRNAS